MSDLRTGYQWARDGALGCIDAYRDEILLCGGEALRERFESMRRAVSNLQNPVYIGDEAARERSDEH